MTGEFGGFPVAALDFYDDLEMDNTKSFWTAHKSVYDECVRAPMVALVTALAEEFGPGKVFRPYRDVRFAKDKTPYKDHQGGFVPSGPGRAGTSRWGHRACGSAPGSTTRTVPGSPPIRDAIDHDLTGAALERLLGELEQDGWSRHGDQLRTTPRGWPADHPRIGLLRHKALYVGRSYGFDDVIHTPALLDRVR